MSLSASCRWAVFSRVVAASVGGYALANLITIALSLIVNALGMQAAVVLLAAEMASFMVWAVIIMAIFHARSATRAWLWLSGAAAVFLLVMWLLPKAGA